MTLVVFKYCLPALLGYILYAGIAGRLLPTRPASLEERPSWLLGAWTGLSVALVLGVGLHLAYGMSLEASRDLFSPAAGALAMLLLPGFGAWLLYRGRISRRLDRETTLRLRPDDFDRFDDSGLIIDASELPFLMMGDFAEPPLALAAPESATESAPEPALESAPESSSVLIKSEESTRADVSSTESVDDAPSIVADVVELESERRLREETETHLRITRKALFMLEAASREGVNARSDAVIALEEELDNRVKASSAAEARAAREASGRIEAETHVTGLKEDVARLRSDLRRGTEARARALAAAQKSVSFARQAVQARERLEARLKENEETLANRQTTISSLIRALEKEKRRTREEVGSMAKQLLLHERQLRARRNLEEVARSVEGKLTNRLVKKVARARPVASND